MTAEAAVSGSDRFLKISAGFDARHWRLLGVLASERRLAVAAFEKLIPGDSAEREAFGLRAFIDASVRVGLFVDAGTAYTMASTRSPGAERAFAIAPAFRPFILRRLADEGALERVRDEARALVGDSSLSEFMTALYAGDEARLGPAVAGLKGRFPNGEELTFARNLLREAVCAPFDADSFARTWRDTGAALRVAEQVLSDALLELDAVEGLYAWTVARLPSDARPSLVRVVCEHALLRGDVTTVFELAKRLPTAEQLSFDAAARYVKGDLLGARSLLADAVAFRDKNKTAAAYTANAAPLLALIALVEEQETGAELARRLVRSPVESPPPLAGFGMNSPLPSAARALRTLLRALKQPDSLEPQPSAHQLGVHAGAWETMILALSVHLHSDAAVGRAAWARRLALASKRWLAAGYAWLGRQAEWLCQALDRGATGEFAAAPPRGAELALADLLQTRPEWRKSLDALLAFSEQATKVEKAAVSERVAWFVDMVTGELTRPVLEEFRSESGWTRGRRVELSELWEVEATLPPEDRALLQHTELRAGRRVFKSDAREALCGHPRVFNGVRGRLPVEVVRGTCRVEVRRERGHLIVEVEPRGAVEGVNVVVDSESRLVVYRVSEQLAKLFRVLPVGLRVPESHQAEALEVLARLAEHVEVRSAELDAHRAVTANSTPCLRISPETGAFWVELGVRPFGAQGRFFPPGFGRVKVSIYQGGDLLDTERDLDEERARCEMLIERCPTLRAARASGLEDGEGSSDTPFSFGLGEEALLDLLLELRESELDCELEWKNGRPLTARGRLGVGSLKGALRRIKGWYIVKGEVALDAVTSVALSSLVEQPFTKTGRFLRLPSGDFVAVEERVRHAISVLRAHSERKGPTAAELRVPDAAFAAIQSLTAADTGFEIDASVSEWHARVESALGRDYPLPEALLATLRPYQVEGYEWLCRSSELGLGVCLADDMGLGKTIQILGLLLTRRAAGPALVVAPTSVCSNWLDEIARFAPSLVAVEYSGKQRGALLARFQTPSAEPVPDVLIVSYALLQQDSESLSAIEWNTAILDEAQFIKNAQSLRAKAAFGLKARYRVAMTGTPVENHLGDLFSIFRFLNESLLGSWKNFQLLYMRPIERDSDSGQREALKRLIQPFMLRRTKDQVLRDLPPITTLRHEVRLSEDEALRYGLLRRQIHEKLRTVAGKRDHKLRVFAEITRLRRFCCHPRLVFPDASHECSKLQTFLELVDELSENGHRALVFSQFVDFLELVREQLDERGIRYLYLDGSTPKAARGARVAAFQAGEAPLFLVSLKAGGFGVNLTAADYVIHLDPWWNPAVEAQATDRAHRIGQTRPVTVYRLITKDTIEEQIVDLHREKRALADALLEGTDVASKLDIDELRALLGPELD